MRQGVEAEVAAEVVVDAAAAGEEADPHHIPEMVAAGAADDMNHDSNAIHTLPADSIAVTIVVLRLADMMTVLADSDRLGDTMIEGTGRSSLGIL